MARNLTAGFVRKVKDAGKYYDTNGLFLRVSRGGSKQWVQRLTVHGRKVDLGLGGFPLISLEEAREDAFENRRLARRGGDPLALKRGNQAPTFAGALDKVIEVHSASWRDGGRTADIWRAQMERYAFPRLGRMTVDAIGTADVMAVLLPIWSTKRETARKVRRRIGAVMKWAVAQGFRQDNPAGEAIGAALPRHGGAVTHYRALAHGEVAAALDTVRASTASIAAKLAFEFLVLTACRSGEVRLARWDEVDMDAKTWTVPDERTKTGRKHVVPLSDGALAVLAKAREIADGTDLLFPAPRFGRAMSDATLSKMLRDNGVAAVPHGFRSSFRDWVGECTNAPREVAEACLAHTIGNATEAAYARSDLLAKRRTLMQQWADYLAGATANVVPIGQAQRRR